MKEIRVKDSNDIPNNYTGVVIYPNGIHIRYKNGKYDDEKGPAVVVYDGYKTIFLHDKKVDEKTLMLDRQELIKVLNESFK